LIAQAGLIPSKHPKRSGLRIEKHPLTMRLYQNFKQQKMVEFRTSEYVEMMGSFQKAIPNGNMFFEDFCLCIH